MSHSQDIAEIAAALAKAQGAMESAKFNRQNPHFKNKYADLAAIREAIREPLSKNGISFTQTMERVLIGDANATELFLRTMLLHAPSGQWIDSYYPLPNGAKPQEFGSALTYARRYSLSAIVGIASDEDDDANEADKIEPKQKPGTPLTRDQIEEIGFYAKELSTERTRAFLNWLDIKNMTEITGANFDRAIAGLKKATGLDIGTGAAGTKRPNKPLPDKSADPAY